MLIHSTFHESRVDNHSLDFYNYKNCHDLKSFGLAEFTGFAVLQGACGR